MFVVRGNDQGCRFELEADQVTIGRDVGNTIQLHDTEISRRHAVLTRDGRRYKLVDNRSSNGTFVNGKRTQTHILSAGDELLLGSTLLLYTGGGDEPSELAKKIDVIARHRNDDRSRIVRTMPQSQGRDMFEPPAASDVRLLNGTAVRGLSPQWAQRIARASIWVISTARSRRTCRDKAGSREVRTTRISSTRLERESISRWRSRELLCRKSVQSGWCWCLRAGRADSAISTPRRIARQPFKARLCGGQL